MQQSFKSYWHIDINPDPESITEVAEYDGSEDLSILCTQLSYTHSPAQQKRIVSEWCDFFSRAQPVRRLWIQSRLPPELFEAICTQGNLRALFIKWSGVKDLSRIEHLQSLTHLYFGGSAGINDISPLAQLTSLLDLSIDNLQKVTDYSPIGKLQLLEKLMISGNSFAPKKININSLAPFAGLTRLQSFCLYTAKIIDNSYQPLYNLRNLHNLVLPPPLNAAEASKLIAALPSLRSGNVLSAQ